MGRRLVGVLALTVVACSPARPMAGTTFGFGPQDANTQCVPARPGSTEANYGLEVLRNGSAETAVLTDVALTDPHGLTVTAFFVVPLARGSTLIGSSDAWPPLPFQTNGAKSWDLAADPGREIPPDATADAVYDLFVHLSRSADLPVSFAGLRLTYVLAGRTYTEDTYGAFEVASVCGP